MAELSIPQSQLEIVTDCAKRSSKVWVGTFIEYGQRTGLMILEGKQKNYEMLVMFAFKHS